MTYFSRQWEIISCLSSFFRSFRTIHIDDMKKLSSLYYIHFYVFDKEALENISEKFAVCSRKCLKMKRKNTEAMDKSGIYAIFLEIRLEKS